MQRSVLNPKTVFKVRCNRERRKKLSATTMPTIDYERNTQIIFAACIAGLGLGVGLISGAYLAAQVLT